MPLSGHADERVGASEMEWSGSMTRSTFAFVSESPLPVLWICGAAGAGKSVAAWGLFEHLARTGIRVAYVDIDQLGMLYPADENDPEAHGLKNAALDALLPGYQAAGTQLLIVSGVVDPHLGPTLTADVDLTLCLLIPEPRVLHDRILARGWDPEDAERAVATQEQLQRADFVDIAIEASRLSIAATVRHVREVAAVRAPSTTPSTTPPPSEADLEVLVITGPRAAGSSTIGFGLASRHWHAEQKTAFLDLQQLGFLAITDRPDVDTNLALGQLAAMHQVVAARGAELMLVAAHLTPLERATMRLTLPLVPLVVVRLRADKATLLAHARARTTGSDARLAGDDLLGSDQEHQDHVVATALAEQAALDDAGLEEVTVDATGRTPEQVILEIEDRVTAHL